MEDENQAIEEELHWYTTKRNEVIERSNWEKVETLLRQYLSMEKQVKEETRVISEVEKKLAAASCHGAKLKNKIEMGASVASSSAAPGFIRNPGSESSKLEKLPPDQFDSKEFMTKRKLETVSMLSL